MRAARNWGPNPAARLLLLVLILAGAWSGSSAIGEAVPAEKKDAEKEKNLFPPEAKKRFKEFLDKAKDAKRKLWVLRMKTEIEEVAKVTALTPEAMSALEPAAQQPIEESIADWLPKFEEYFRKLFQRSSVDLSTVFDQILPQVDAYVKMTLGGDATPPQDQASWNEALKRALTAEQGAAWEKARTERRRALEKEIGDALKAMTDATRDQRRVSILAKSADIKRELNLSKDRADALDALAKSAAAKSADDWSKRAEKMLFSMEDQQRRQIMAMARVYISPEATELPEQQAVWKDGLAKLLSAAELQRLQSEQDEHRARRFRALGQIMLVELDQKVAFTASQRERLRPIAERVMKDRAESFPEGSPEDYVNYPPQTFFMVAANAPEAEVKPILDSIQWKHWQESCDPKNIETYTRNPSARKLTAVVDDKQALQVPEPEDFEDGISDFLQEKTAKERRRKLGALILKAEDAGRVTGLAPEAIERLKTAARGATEETLAAWKSMVDDTVRSQVRDVSPQNLRQRLDSIQDYYFERRTNELPEKQPVWEKTVKTEMTAEQQAVWQKAVDERNAYRDKSIASLVLSSFDSRNPISAAQWEKLEPIVARIATEYAPEMSNFFSSSNSSRWYLQSYTMFMPFAGIPEKDFKSILSKEQWDRWMGSNEFSNAASYWENIRDNHAQRVKEKK